MKSIVPAIIPGSYEDIVETLRPLRSVADRIQIDIMNGTHTPGRSWPYDSTDKTSFDALMSGSTGLPYWEAFDYEADLLLREPERYIDDWVKAGVTSCIVHVETTSALEEIFARQEAWGIGIALALLPSTESNVLAPWIEQAEFVQCMGSDTIGFHGVPLDERVVEKLEDIHARWPEVTIGVDIGVSEETLPTLMAAGATRFAVGSAVLEAAEPKVAYNTLVDIATL